MVSISDLVRRREMLIAPKRVLSTESWSAETIIHCKIKDKSQKGYYDVLSLSARKSSRQTHIFCTIRKQIDMTDNP